MAKSCLILGRDNGKVLKCHLNDSPYFEISASFFEAPPYASPTLTPNKYRITKLRNKTSDGALIAGNAVCDFTKLLSF